MYRASSVVDKVISFVYNNTCKKYAGVAELADALDLGSSGNTVQVQVLSPAPVRVAVTDLLLLFFFSMISLL